MPPNLQWATLITSFLMVIKAGIETYFQYDKPSRDLQAAAKKIAGQLPMFITAYVSKLGSGALLAVIFSYWTIPAYLAAWWLLECYLQLTIRRGEGSLDLANYLDIWARPGPQHPEPSLSRGLAGLTGRQADQRPHAPGLRQAEVRDHVTVQVDSRPAAQHYYGGHH